MKPDAVNSVLDRAETVMRELIGLTRELVAARVGNDDEWTRMPSGTARCPVSRFSRSKLNRLISAGRVRSKITSGCRFYAAADVRKILNEP